MCLTQATYTYMKSGVLALGKKIRSLFGIKTKKIRQLMHNRNPQGWRGMSVVDGYNN
jgi:hypothetical protein